MRKLIVLLLFAILAFFISCSSSQYKNMQITLPDLSIKTDGTYRGEANFSGVPTKVTLDTVLQNHRIVSITIISHSASSIGRKAEVIIEEIIKRQSLDVDVVSGSTVSSNAIRKAVENALQ